MTKIWLHFAKAGCAKIRNDAIRANIFIIEFWCGGRWLLLQFVWRIQFDHSKLDRSFQYVLNPLYTVAYVIDNLNGALLVAASMPVSTAALPAHV